MAKYLLEAKQPANGEWMQLHPPEWWAKEEHTPDDDLFVAASPRSALRSWLDAYPGYGKEPGKPFTGFRATKVDGRRRIFRIVEINQDALGDPEPVYP